MRPSDFRFYLGSLALNFAATLAYRRGTPIERLPTPTDLGRWLAQAQLTKTAVGVKPAELRDALALREAIFAVGDALVAGRKPAVRDIIRINEVACGGPPVVQMNPRTFALESHAHESVSTALAAIATDAIVQFTTNRAKLGHCEDAQCTALTLSKSRGAARRWCSMQSCGNRAKVAAYRTRAK